jgi:hypothetical protein
MSASSQQPVSLPTDDAPVDSEIAGLIEQVKEGRFESLRHYLAGTRASGEWQDRLFLLERVAPHASIDLLNASCEAEPESPDLLVLRCAYYSELSKTLRGSGTANQVDEARYRNAAASVQAAMTDMAKSTQLDAQDPTAFTLMLKPLTIFNQTESHRKGSRQGTGHRSPPRSYLFRTHDGCFRTMGWKSRDLRRDCTRCNEQGRSGE